MAYSIAWALVHPPSLRPVYTNWMRLGLILNRIVSPVVLGIVFFLVVTPMGLIMRLAGRNPVKGHASENGDSYRVASKARKPDHLERPY